MENWFGKTNTYMPESQSINAMTDRIIALRDKLQWKRFHTPTQISLTMQVELGKLYQEFMWRTDDQIYEQVSTKLDQKGRVSEQIADVLLNLLILAKELKIDLTQSVSDKLTSMEKQYTADIYKGKAKTDVQSSLESISKKR
jgi:NTP pyrophosphatase (non-canonical NTP hydrolase)